MAAAGAFENIDPTIAEVLFVGRPAGSNRRALGGRLGFAGARRAQRLIGQRPLVGVRARRRLTNPYQWRAIVWPLAPGAAGDEDLSINGPNSEYVIAVSEEWPSQ